MNRGVFSRSSVLLLLVAVFVAFCTTDIYAQKFVKHKNNKYSDVKVWWEVRYPDGSVGLSVNDKKNIVVDGGRGYSSVEYIYLHGRFKVTKGNYQGVVDAEGREIISPVKFSSVKDKYEYTYPEPYKYYEVGVGGSSYSPEKVGICNYAGSEMLPCEFNYIITYKEQCRDTDFFYHYVSKSQQGEPFVGLYDTAGRNIFPMSKYSYVSPYLKTKSAKKSHLSENNAFLCESA